MKSYTSLEQSKKLAKILPLESADMYYEWPNKKVHFKDDKYSGMGSSCWSLYALLDNIPQVILDSIKQHNKKLWRCCADWHNSEWRDNPIDACYEMILKLHEQKLL